MVPYRTNKFQPKSKPCVFLGYSLTQHAFKCLDLHTGKLYHSRHVTFDENQFPFSHSKPPISTDPLSTCLTVTPPSPVPPVAIAPSTTAPVTPALPPAMTSVSSSPSPGMPSLAHSNNSTNSASSFPVDPPPPTRTHHMVTRAQNNIFCPKQLSVTTKHPLVSPLAPTCVSQALKDPRWRKAMADEFTALISHGTWELVPKSSAPNLIGCKWVFRIKRNPDGTVDRFKARLVAKGFNQRPGVDYTETFSPVIKPTTIRLILSLALSNGWSLKQIDVNNAFLHGQLTEQVFMQQPAGFIDANFPHHVCSLKKSLYGLKQAPRAWFNALCSGLIELGFFNSKSDSSLFIYNRDGILFYILVYVDDLILTGNNAKFMQHVVCSLGEKFSLKELNDLHYFLGVEVIPAKQGLFLSQNRYVHDLLTTLKMDGAKEVHTPMSASAKLLLDDGSANCDAMEFRRTIGSLQYLSLTRPDLCFAVNRLAQFMHKPTVTHWQHVKRLLRYVKQTIHFGLLLRRQTNPVIRGFSDADWGGDLDDRKSTTAYIIFLGDNPISWRTRKQKAVARSSTEAEYRALATAASDIAWIQSLLDELGIQIREPPTLLCDNVGATQLSLNPVMHSRMKHIAIDLHFVRDFVRKGKLRVAHVHTDD